MALPRGLAAFDAAAASRRAKAASRLLQPERRLSRGFCPPVELLTENAIRQAYGE